MGLKEGLEAEERASLYLQTIGFKIIERNFHSKFGEIDIIASKEGILHFCEVKFSQTSDPILRITPAKMVKIIKTIGYYFFKNHINCNYEIDAILVTPEKIEMINNITL